MWYSFVSLLLEMTPSIFNLLYQSYHWLQVHIANKFMYLPFVLCGQWFLWGHSFNRKKLAIAYCTCPHFQSPNCRVWSSEAFHVRSCGSALLIQHGNVVLRHSSEDYGRPIWPNGINPQKCRRIFLNYLQLWKGKNNWMTHSFFLRCPNSVIITFFKTSSENDIPYDSTNRGQFPTFLQVKRLILGLMRIYYNDISCINNTLMQICQ